MSSVARKRKWSGEEGAWLCAEFVRSNARGSANKSRGFAFQGAWFESSSSYAHLSHNGI